jgi:hypothetical protein
MLDQLNGATAAVNPLPSPSDDRRHAAQFAVMARLVTGLQLVIKDELARAKPPRPPRRKGTRLFYRKTCALMPDDINLIVNTLSRTSLWLLYVAIQLQIEPTPQERLAAVVDEIGLDRTINLLHCFEMTA